MNLFHDNFVPNHERPARGLGRVALGRPVPVPPQEPQRAAEPLLSWISQGKLLLQLQTELTELTSLPGKLLRFKKVYLWLSALSGYFTEIGLF